MCRSPRPVEFRQHAISRGIPSGKNEQTERKSAAHSRENGRRDFIYFQKVFPSEHKNCVPAGITVQTSTMMEAVFITKHVTIVRSYGYPPPPMPRTPYEPPDVAPVLEGGKPGGGGGGGGADRSSIVGPIGGMSFLGSLGGSGSKPRKPAIVIQRVAAVREAHLPN